MWNGLLRLILDLVFIKNENVIDFGYVIKIFSYLIFIEMDIEFCELLFVEYYMCGFLSYDIKCYVWLN